MNLEGLDYNTSREKMKLKAYGRDIQQMVDMCVNLPTKEERQKCAEAIIETMKRVIPSQLSYKERTPILWYHLALMSDFTLDIDYPVEIVHEDELAKMPNRIPYTNKKPMPVRHYGRLIFSVFEKLKTMEPGEERDALAKLTAEQMYRSIVAWGMTTSDAEKVVSDMARYTDGLIQMSPEDLDDVMSMPLMPQDDYATAAQKKKKKKKK